MTRPINRGSDEVSRLVFALIFNGISRGQDGEWWLPLSMRQALADAVFEELKAGGIEVRVARSRHSDRTARAVRQMGA